MKKCKQGYYYCYKDKKCKKIPLGYRIGLGGWLRKEKDEETEEKKKNGNGNGANGNGNGNGESNGGSNGGGVSEAWSSKYKKSIDCDNPKGFSQRAHCRGRKKISEEAVSRKQQKFFGIVRAIQKGELEPTTPETAKAAATMKKSDVKDFASTKHKGLPEKKKMNEQSCPICNCDPCQCLEGNITEARDGKSSKDKGYSLRDWFKGGGWKQTGGKYDGKPCAKQPGQKTKPYCRDADDRAAMSKEERNKRARKKRKEDPNPNRKGKAKNVTQESYSNWRSDLEQLDEFFGLFGPKTVTPKDSPSGTQSVTVGKKYPARQNRKPVDVTYDKEGNKTVTPMSPARAGVMQYKYGSTWGMPQYNSYQPEGEVVEGYDEIRSYDRIKRLDGRVRSFDDDKRDKNKKVNPTVQLDKAHFEPEGELVDEEGRSVFSTPGLDRKKKVQDYLKNTDKVLRPQKPTVELDKAHYEPEGDMVDEGKKDACYHKVKSRYSVWPSAYASGALVKCRKVGAKNWGNKTKKESVDYSNWRDDFQALEIETIDLIKADPIEVPPSRIDIIKEGAKKRMLDEKCWKGYEKKGMKTMFGKRYPNCVKKKKTRKEEFEVSEGKYTRGEIYKKGTAPHRDPVAGESYPKEIYKKKVRLADEVELGEMKNGGDNDPCWDTHKQVGMKKKGGKMVPNCVPKEEHSDWRAEINIQEAMPGYDKYNAAVAAANKLKGRDKINALKAAAALRPPTEKEVNKKIPESHELGEGAAWTKKEGKNKSGGLNEKGRKSYERENPGSDLKRPSKKVGNKRRKSFCARMKGMKKKLTSKKTANDPDSRINKSLRAWNC